MKVDELLNAAKCRSISPDVFITHLWALSKGLKRTGRRYRTGDAIFFRTRVFPTDIRPSSIRDLSYPPAELCRLQRASGVGSQIFYASAGMPTTLAESRVKEGEFIVGARWRNLADLTLQEVGLADLDDERERLYNSIFTEPGDSLYPYTSKIAEHLMSGPTISGLLYPSIINKNKSHNVALKKTYVDGGLGLTSATCYRMYWYRFGFILIALHGC